MLSIMSTSSLIILLFLFMAVRGWGRNNQNGIFRRSYEELLTERIGVDNIALLLGQKIIRGGSS
jgi:hypothetical protein